MAPEISDEELRNALVTFAYLLAERRVQPSNPEREKLLAQIVKPLRKANDQQMGHERREATLRLVERVKRAYTDAVSTEDLEQRIVLAFIEDDDTALYSLSEVLRLFKLVVTRDEITELLGPKNAAVEKVSEALGEAELLRVSPKTLYNWQKRQRGPQQSVNFTDAVTALVESLGVKPEDAKEISTRICRCLHEDELAQLFPLNAAQ